MHQDVITVRTLTSRLEDFIGQRVEVEGYFVLAEGDGYLVESREPRDSLRESVQLVVSNLKQKALAVIPPYAGSKYYYYHAASATGTVARCSDGPYACCLVDVSEIEAEVSGEKFLVRFSPPPDA